LKDKGVLNSVNVLLPYKKIKYSTQSKVIEFFVDIYYFDHIKESTNLIFLLRKRVKTVTPSPLEGVKIAELRRIPSSNEVVSRLKKLYSSMVDRLTELGKWIELNKFASSHYRFLALSGLVPQRMIGDLVNVDKKYIQYKVLRSILSELRLNEVTEIYECREVVWRMLRLKQEEGKVLFLENGETWEHIDRIYSKLYEIDEGFREATDNLLSI